MRAFLLAAGILAAGFVSSLSANTVSGVVAVRQGDRVVPVFRASVVAREAAGSDIVAVARTDREGRFLIVDLPTPRVALSVRKHGHYTRLINGREDDSVVLDCSAPQDCAGVQFELGMAGVISGFAVDELGEPLEELGVMVSRGDASSEEGDSRVAQMETDDRGYFRAAGLKPGVYVVKGEGSLRTGFRPQPVESDAVEVEVTEGGETGGVQLVVRFAEQQRGRHKLSGRITGVELTKEGRHMVQIRHLPNGNGRRRGGDSTAAVIDADGLFRFEGLVTGRYTLHYLYQGNQQQGRGMRWQQLGTIDVSGDLSGLVLSPLAPTGFSGSLKFETARAPRSAQLWLTTEDGDVAGADRVDSPDFEFRLNNLTPGNYKVRVSAGWRGRDGFYVKGIQRGEEFAAGNELVAVEGVTEAVDIVVSDEVARVYGRVKAAVDPGAEQPIQKGAQFQVALAGPDQRVRVTQADQYGRFHFDDVVPGEYRVCGWADLEGRSVHRDETWEQAGSAVRRFAVEAGSDVELDLTAVP